MSAPEESAHILARIAIIAAMTEKRVIGSHGKLPWHHPEDLQLFKRLTINATVIMGRNTYASIGKPLPDRTNIVLSRSGASIEGATVCARLIDALIIASNQNQPAFVIGGEGVYRKALPLATELHISWIKRSHDGDTYFPEFTLNEWQECERVDYQEFTYVKYLRE